MSASLARGAMRFSRNSSVAQRIAVELVPEPGRGGPRDGFDLLGRDRRLVLDLAHVGDVAGQHGDDLAHVILLATR